jgi:hypothetical protein
VIYTLFAELQLKMGMDPKKTAHEESGHMS